MRENSSGTKLRQDVLIRELIHMIERRVERWELEKERQDVKPSREREVQEEGEVRSLCEGLEVFLAPRNVYEELLSAVGKGKYFEFNIRKSIESVRSSKAVVTMKGKARLLLRLLLHNRQLHPGLLLLVSQVPSPLLELAGQVDRSPIPWQVEPSNNCWLDLTWQLPVIETFLLVPTHDLGIHFKIVNGRPVVLKVDAGSVADEDSKVEVGDVITHINEEVVLHSPRGDGADRLCGFLGKAKRQPITLTITKVWDRTKQEMFPPIVSLLTKLRIDVEDLERSCFLTRRGKRPKDASFEEEDFNPLEDDDSDREEGEEANLCDSGYLCLYLGSVNLGPRGHVDQGGGNNNKYTWHHQDLDQIEAGISAVVRQSPAGAGHPAILRVRELEVILTRHSTGETVLNIPYPSMSSCGRLLAQPQYFAFISASHAQSGNFMCHVFYSSKENDAKEILDSIGEGFHRTTFTV